MDTKGYRPTIGLEIHAQLKTKTKLFSSSPNNPEATDPNSIVSPIDAGHPGTLPALNYQAVENVIKFGLAVESNVAEYTEWDRKNYFYPDIPKAYQISQYKYPLVTGGQVAGVELTRVHLEEDTGKSIHDQGDYSLVDLNRAGMPLMELVTEPTIHSADQASRFAKELQLILRYLDIGEANLEKGEMRIEANISVSKTDEFGTKVEVKNLNSFKSVERAIEYEIQRQIELIESGGEVVQETRGWDENKQVTFSQRAKEDAHDYRYFPDPDLPKLYVSEVFDLESMKSTIDEMPQDRRNVLLGFGLDNQKVELLVEKTGLYHLFKEVTAVDGDLDPIKVVNIITAELLGLEQVDSNGVIEFSPAILAEIISMYQTGKISSTSVKLLLEHYVSNNDDTNPEVLAKQKDLIQKGGDEYFDEVFDQIAGNNPEVIEQYKAGEDKVMAFIIGQAMKYSKGQINPKEFSTYLQNKLR